MSWLDFDTDPPTPMGMEDGEPAPLWNACALQCAQCKKWYISYDRSDQKGPIFCSPGCAMTWNEEKAQGKS